MPDVGIQPLPRARTWSAAATCVQQRARVSTKPRVRFPGRREGVQVPRSFRSISHSRRHMLIHICAHVRAHVHTCTQHIHIHTHICSLLCVHAGTRFTHTHRCTLTRICTYIGAHTPTYTRPHALTHVAASPLLTETAAHADPRPPHAPPPPRRSSALAMQMLPK